LRKPSKISNFPFNNLIIIGGAVAVVVVVCVAVLLVLLVIGVLRMRDHPLTTKRRRSRRDSMVKFKRN